jgi:predicted XRE-type DNA-binding protein
MSNDMELERGSGNVFRDLGLPDSDTELIKANLAAEIIGILDQRKLTTRAAGRLVGIAHSDIVNIRNVKLKGFSIERLIRVLNALDRRVELKVEESQDSHAA